ncbi:MAG: tail fiber domain-containing protein, partial [Salinivirgaceae bacterium]|nr:tail fiber domain-containing protein [Salinivirgaceae bacterium]
DDTASGKAAKAKFAVAGKSGKADDNLLVVNEAGTKVYVDDDGTKAAKAKFAVAGKSGGKANTNPNYLTIDNESTRIYIDDAPAGSKAAKSGFAVAGKSGGKTGSDELFNIDLTQTAEVINDENRVYWYPKKNAFMAGKLNVTSADSVGENSFNAGYQNKAIGDYSQALGFQSRAKGEYATAIGKNANADKDNAYAFGNNARAIGTGSYAIGANAEAKGTSSFAIGSVGQDSLGNSLSSAKAIADFSYAIGAGTVSSAKGALATGVKTTASGEFSTAMGYETRATGQYSTAIGLRATASGKLSYAAGYSCSAEGETSIAMGTFSRALGDGSVAIGTAYYGRKGHDELWIGGASGKYSTVMGYSTRALSFGETAIGIYNTTYEPNSTIDYNQSDRLFVIGNGIISGHNVSLSWNTKMSDALIIYKNGNAEFRGNVYPSSEPNVWTEAETYSLGTSNNKWNAVYANKLYGTLQTSSDIRYKTEIKPLERALDKVLTLSGVTYKWRASEFPEQHFDNKTHIGVIAQEVEKVFPELVNTDESGYKSVEYANIAPVLIEAIKELKAEKDALEAKLDKQEKEMAEMKKMLEELMKKQ